MTLKFPDRFRLKPNRFSTRRLEIAKRMPQSHRMRSGLLRDENVLISTVNTAKLWANQNRQESRDADGIPRRGGIVPNKSFTRGNSAQVLFL